MLKRLISAAALAAALTLPGQAPAMDFATYLGTAKDAVRELISGNIADPAAALARQEKLMALGVEGCKERAAAVPDDAKLMELVVASAEAMKAMSPEQLEEAWGDEGKAGDAIGKPLKAIDQFSLTRNYLDAVVHPARAYTFIKAWQTSKDPQNLAQAKGELNEVLEHVSKIETATKK